MADATPSPIVKMKSWIESFNGDVNAVLALVGEPRIDREARILASAALSYLVTRLDLIPDWEESAGIIDDAMVLRVAMAIVAERDLDALEDDAQRVVHRLANENDLVRELLGDDLHGRLRDYVRELVNVIVRGRHPRAAVDDEKERAQLAAEVRDELRRHQSHPPMKDPEAIARTVKNYLTTKLADSK